MFLKNNENDEDKQTRISQFLAEDRGIASQSLEPIKVFILPLKEKNKKGLFIWFYFTAGVQITHQSIFDIATHILAILNKNIIIDEYDGIEIIPSCRIQNGESDRIVRISIWRRGYQNWVKMRPSDIRINKPYEGIECGWYWDPETMKSPIDTQ